MSPAWTSRDGLTGCPLDSILPSSQARAARERVLKNRAAQSHLSILTLVMILLPDAPLGRRRIGDSHRLGGGLEGGSSAEEPGNRLAAFRWCRAPMVGSGVDSPLASAATTLALTLRGN